MGADTDVIQSSCISGLIREKELPRARSIMPAHPIAPPRAQRSPKNEKECFWESFEIIAQTTPENANVSPINLTLVNDSFGNKK